MKITCYHATDRACAVDIIQNRFLIKANMEHWLGDGIYFFTDKCLADWWLKNPSGKYGVKITNPVIVKTTIDIPKEQVLDLRNLDEYTETINDLKKYFGRMFAVNVSDLSRVPINWKQLQCAFFNYYKEYKHKTLIIGSFDSEEQPYRNGNNGNVLDFSDLQYVETQVCLQESAQNYINSKEIL